MHAFPIATLFLTLVMFLLMAQLLVIGRMSIWAGWLKCWPGIKEWFGGTNILLLLYSGLMTAKMLSIITYGSLLMNLSSPFIVSSTIRTIPY